MPKLGSKIGRVPNLILSLHDTLDCRQIQGCFCPHISKDSPVNTAPLAFTHRLFHVGWWVVAHFQSTSPSTAALPPCLYYSLELAVFFKRIGRK